MLFLFLSVSHRKADKANRKVWGCSQAKILAEGWGVERNERYAFQADAHTFARFLHAFSNSVACLQPFIYIVTPHVVCLYDSIRWDDAGFLALPLAINGHIPSLTTHPFLSPTPRRFEGRCFKHRVVCTSMLWSEAGREQRNMTTACMYSRRVCSILYVTVLLCPRS